MQENQITRQPSLTKTISSLKCLTPIALVLSIISIIFAFILYSQQKQNFEFLLLGIDDIIITFTLILIICWIFTLDVDYENASFEASDYSYIVQLGLQCCSAITLGLIITMIQYNTHKQHQGFTMLQIIKMGINMLIINFCKQLNKNQNGIHRFILIGSIILNSIFLILAATNFKFIVYLINNQVFQLDNNNSALLFMQYALIVLLGATVLLSIIIFFRVQNYFLIIAFLIIMAVIIAATANGIIIRQYNYLTTELSTKQGCRNALQSIGKHTVQELFSCSTKYINQKESPYLSCPQENQTYLWESNINQLGCINPECCDSLQGFLIQPIYRLTIWINILIAVGIIQAFNTAMLSTFITGNRVQNILNDLIMIFSFAVVTAALIAIYNAVPTQDLQLQDQLVQSSQILNQLQVLPTPNYSGFKPQQRLAVLSNMQTCEIAENLILTKINLKPPSNLNEPGILLAISGSGGQFTITNNLNLEDIKFLNTDDLVKQIFPKANKPGHDSIIVQGSVASIGHLLGSCLYFCSDEPESADFDVVQEFIDLEPTNSRLLALDPGMQAQVNKFIAYLTIIADVQNSEDFTPIQGATGTIYPGKFVYASCQVMDEFQSPFLNAISDSNGELLYHNVASKQVYTILVKKSGYKHACALVDLTELKPKTKIYIRMVKDVSVHSMKVILEWTSQNTNFDLYGQYSVDGVPCITGALSKSCGGMHIQNKSNKDQHVEILTVEQIQPHTYLIFVKRFMERTQAIDNTANPQDWIEAAPTVTLYVNELKYPLVQYRLPSMPTKMREKIDITWLVFQLDGQQGDKPIELRTYWSEISNESIKNSESYKSKFWPSPIEIK